MSEQGGEILTGLMNVRDINERLKTVKWLAANYMILNVFKTQLKDERDPVRAVRDEDVDGLISTGCKRRYGAVELLMNPLLKIKTTEVYAISSI